MKMPDHDEALLDARTEALARPIGPLIPPDTLTVVALVFGPERWLLPMDALIGVAPLKRLTPLPWAPPWLAGMTAVRGAITPVFYLHALLGLPLRALPEGNHVALLGTHDAPLGLIVDSVEPHRPLDLATLHPVPTSSLGDDVRAWVRGVDPMGNHLLDAAALLASPRTTVDVPYAPRVRGTGE